MPIPDSQLSSWAGLGAQQGSATTYASIKAALSAHAWPTGMNWLAYLQGSYANATNIGGDRDVDVVVESTNVFYENAEDRFLAQLGFTRDGSYNWKDFRDEVRTALVNYYGSSAVSESSNGKCLKVSASSSRLAAFDVVPCITFKSYSGVNLSAQGSHFGHARAPRL